MLEFRRIHSTWLPVLHLQSSVRVIVRSPNVIDQPTSNTLPSEPISSRTRSAVSQSVRASEDGGHRRRKNVRFTNTRRWVKIPRNTMFYPKNVRETLRCFMIRFLYTQRWNTKIIIKKITHPKYWKTASSPGAWDPPAEHALAEAVAAVTPGVWATPGCGVDWDSD